MKRILLACLLLTAPVLAHHIMGIPHYAYDEDYPQTPVLTYAVDAGLYSVKMTGYPGRPKPGDSCTFNVYINPKSGGPPFDGEVRMTLTRDELIGIDPVVYGPITASLDEAVYKFHPTLEKEANYVARIEFEGADEPWSIDLPIVAGEPGSPWVVLLSLVGGIVCFLVVVRAIRIKKARRERKLAREIS